MAPPGPAAGDVPDRTSLEHSPVAILGADATVLVEVADDGVGFPPEVVAARAAAARGFGLFSIRERLRHLGASFVIESAPGQGSRVELRAPVRAAPAAPSLPTTSTR